jgi:CHASE3 domain sensor protein/putative methionine-R-sulfoxide reductase with GAF domain/anti-sigma regulatory factor (Ser/Thr protein kinase)
MHPKLDFSQKIWLGFGFIILLLSLSSGVSLYNLYDIKSSTQVVNDSAVPTLKGSNQLQISLLKLAKTSSSGYNAINQEQILEMKTAFKLGVQEFDMQFKQLKTIVANNPEMLEQLSSAKSNYDQYVIAVNEMFEAKTNILKAQQQAKEELQNLSNLIDDAGAFLLDVVWVEYADDDKNRELIEGIAGRIDGLIIGLFNTFEDLYLSNNLETLKQGKTAISDAINGIRVRNESAVNNIPSLPEKQKWIDYQDALNQLAERGTADNSLVDYKLTEVEQTLLAREKLDQSEAAINEVVATLDALLVQADTIFNTSQNAVMDAVDIGSTTALIAWVILIILAWQNFNSMRKSIKKKMADLAKLNSTGEELAATQNQTKALESVLTAMHEQTGVSYGSVFLMNNEDRLEIKASYPPKKVDPNIKPAQFALGEGVLGKAAASKKIKFVPNIAKDPDFVSDGKVPDRALLCVPLLDNDVLIGVMNFSGDVHQVVFEDSDYEFASSIARLLVTTIKNIRMREVIEEQNRTLEQKVKERTAELRQKNKDIATMMANLHQGLFTIMDGGVIHGEYSAYLEKILGTDNIANRNFMDVLFENALLGTDTLDQIKNAVDSLIGSDEMMFDFNSHLLVTEVTKELADGQHQLLELDWVPIVNQNTNEIEKLMVTVRDVTELRALQAAAEEQKRELEIIGQILAVDPDKFEEFLNSSYQFISQCRNLIEKAENKDPELVASLFRNMHTVKGNARTYGFSYITDTVHNVEHTYDEYRKDESKQWQPEVLLEDLSKAEQDIKRYQLIAEEKLGKRSSGKGILIDHSKIRELINQALAIEVEPLPDKAKQWFYDAYQILAKTQAQPLEHVLAPVITSINSLAKQLNKPEPLTVIRGDNCLIRKEIHNMLNNVFMHVLRNAVDHGFESAEERKVKGKKESGQIEVHVKRLDDTIEISVSDDGRGLALEKIYQSAVEKGLFEASAPRPPDNEIAQLIFSSGLSTAAEVTDISGRGVGMDAVKRFLQEAGGDINIQLAGGADGDAFRPFKTIINISNKYVMNTPEFYRGYH